jgi:hypothetical protein
MKLDVIDLSTIKSIEHVLYFVDAFIRFDSFLVGSLITMSFWRRILLAKWKKGVVVSRPCWSCRNFCGPTGHEVYWICIRSTSVDLRVFTVNTGCSETDRPMRYEGHSKRLKWQMFAACEFLIAAGHSRKHSLFPWVHSSAVPYDHAVPNLATSSLSYPLGCNNKPDFSE